MEQERQNHSRGPKQGPPRNISIYGLSCLQSLAAKGLGDKVSIGGALGLLHYLDYRSTHDVDAWWTPAATLDDRKMVVQIVEDTLKQYGQTKRRVWGDVTSIELSEKGKVIFTFQIANRTVQLAPSAYAPWVNVLLDSFSDLLASKMVALVERGAPRDFRDIYELCRSGLTKPLQCWQLWMRRQASVGSDTEIDRARLAIQTHLARIAQHRPLESITDEASRHHAQQVRDWFSTEFLEALDELH